MCTTCGIKHAAMLRAGSIVGALYHKLYTQSSAPEDGRNYRPKHVELIELFKKLSLLHLVGCLYYCIRWVTKVPSAFSIYVYVCVYIYIYIITLINLIKSVCGSRLVCSAAVHLVGIFIYRVAQKNVYTLYSSIYLE